MIPYGRQEVTQSDIDAVVAVLQSDFLTQGPMVPRFEQVVARHVGATYAVAVNSATSALHLACLALELGPDDYLWTSPITFAASANCALYCGAKVDFVDIDSRTHNLCPLALTEKLAWAKRENCLPKIVVPVHMAGQSCDMRAIRELADLYGFRIIEDASHAIGGKYRNRYVGNCEYSDITVFSFHPVKIITTGEGGMALTNDAGLAASMALLRTHGITRDQTQMLNESDGPWYYEQVDLGFNYRMTDVQAALGISQMQRLDTYVAKRHMLAQRYDRLLAGLPLVNTWQHGDTYSGMHLYVVSVQFDQVGKPRAEVFQQLRERNIGVNVHYIPVHLHPYYRNLGFKHGDFPKSEHYYEQALSLPLYPTMTEAQQDQVIAALTEVLTK